MTNLGVAGAALWLAGAAFAADVPAASTLELLRRIPHSGYSEGLDFHEGFLWNSQPTLIAKIDPADGSVLARYTPSTTYSESLSWWGTDLLNLSFADDSIHLGHLEPDKLAFTKCGSVPEVHGWGATHDDHHWIITGDYSIKLYFLDRKTCEVKHTIDAGVTALEDLAWDGKWIWASSFTQHRGEIFRIDPKNGAVKDFYKIPTADECPVIDGIAYDGKNLWVTGKNCIGLYYLKLPPR